MSVADNCVISAKGVGQPRRGQRNCIASSDDLFAAVTAFQGQLIINTAAPLTLAGALGYATVGVGSSFSAYSGTFNPVDGPVINTPRMKFAQANDYLHFCTTTGPKTLEGYSGTPRTSGLLPQPNVIFAGVLATTSLAPGFLPYNSSVAYRTMMRRATSNGTSLLSPPSPRVVVSNRILATGGVSAGAMVRSASTTVTVTMPSDFSFLQHGLAPGGTFSLSPGEPNFAAGTYTVSTITANVMTYADAGSNTHNTVTQDLNPGPGSLLAGDVAAFLSPDAVAGDFIRLYRSVNTSLSTVAPSDELWLTNEVELSSGDITAGYVVIQDTTPQSQLVDPLYTNPNLGGGADSANFPPPLYRDVAVWNSQTWYLNTTGFQELRMQMLGVGATNGVQNNDTLTITANATGYVFEFKTTAGAGEVQIVSDGLPGHNIAATTQNLLVVINAAMLSAGVSIRAYSSTAQGQDPGGSILLQRTDFDAAFTVAASRALSWTPALTATSDNNRAPNNLAPSKLMQPEAVAPIDALADIGSKSYPGLRVLALKQSLIVCKGGDGIYAVTGVPGSYQVRQISTANVIAPDCCAVFSDQAWVYTDQGILKVTDSGGCQVISRQIETELNALYAARPAQFYGRAFAVPYETERLILFYVPVADGPDASDTAAFEAFCYCNATQAWTRFNRRAECGVVALLDDHSHSLILAGWTEEFATNSLTFERKALTYLDDADEEFAGTITAVSADKLTLTLASAAHLDVGDGILQDSGTEWRSKILAIDGNDVTVLDAAPWTAAGCTLFKSYPFEAQFLPVGNPTDRKSAASLVLLFKRDGYETALGKVTVLTSEVQAEVEIAVPCLGFGQAGFGVGQFGDPSPIAYNVQPISPSDAAQYFVGIKSSEVWRKTLFEGFSLGLAKADGPAGRGRP